MSHVQPFHFEPERTDRENNNKEIIIKQHPLDKEEDRESKRRIALVCSTL